MPAFSQFSESEIWQLRAYVQALRGNAIEAPVPGNSAHGEEIF
jgi:mono/diheme cytochrome c family protein